MREWERDASGRRVMICTREMAGNGKIGRDPARLVPLVVGE